ncbi:MAG: molybdopterin-binding protein [Syntrophobacteraceae bacterium]
MKVLPVQRAVGMVLCHDVTQIVPGKFKGPAFRKGHILREEDIPRLLSMGKENIYAWDICSGSGLLHENEAAERIARAAAGPNIDLTAPKEGKVDFVAAIDGLLKIQVEALIAVNAPEIVLATIHTHQRVTRGKVLAGARVIPLVIDEGKVQAVEHLCSSHRPLIEVVPFVGLDVGIITTGSEVYHGRIEDQFGPVVKRKLEEFGCRVIGQCFASDDPAQIQEAIRYFLSQGARMITVTGGMSVDPDDVTPAAIRRSGARVVTYGAPVLPGAMFMLAYLGDIPILGLPGCVMYHRTSIFDVILPRLLAGEEMDYSDIARLAHGGLCVHCTECRYPDCGFAKGA